MDIAIKSFFSPLAIFLRLSDDSKTDTKALLDEKEETADITEEGDWLICAICKNRITKASFKTEKFSSYNHTFTNPHGYTFNIRCFNQAPGCSALGPATMEHSWFAGYAWQLSPCGNCGVHLGWKFLSSDDTFYGLIKEQLIEEE